MYDVSQGQVFIIFLVIGLCIGVFFDLFRVLRKTFKTSDFVTLIEDIIFMAIVGFFIINTLILINNGQIRLYIVFAIFFGMSFYFLTISKVCFFMFQIFINFFKKVLFFPIFIKNSYQKKKDFR